MFFAYAKTKAQISCAVNATPIVHVHSLYLLNLKFEASMVVQHGLCRTLAGSPKTDFLTNRLILFSFASKTKKLTRLC